MLSYQIFRIEDHSVSSRWDIPVLAAKQIVDGKPEDSWGGPGKTGWSIVDAVVVCKKHETTSMPSAWRVVVHHFLSQSRS
jgi:hypothetical protein